MGIVCIDFSRSIRQRVTDRYFHIPHKWQPAPSGSALVFYQAQDGLSVQQPASFRLRLCYANQFLSTTWPDMPLGYFIDDQETTFLSPILARLPHNGYLAGWTMGPGALALLEPHRYKSPTQAAWVAHVLSAHASDDMRDNP